MAKFNKKIIVFLSSAAFVLGVSFAISAKAGGASLYLSPNNGTFYVGNTFDVSIFVNTGDKNVNTVRVDLKFDPKKIQLANPTTGKSFISVWIAPPSYSNTEGTLTFQGGLPSPGINTSAGLVSTITFRAISPGDADIHFLNSSQILLDDGNGTNALNSMEMAEYSIAVLPPEGPKVSSLTHFDLNKWRKNNNPTFSWEKTEGVADFSHMIDQDSQGVPDSVSEGPGTSISYSNMQDGIWYFHIKAKKDEAWGGTSHYVALIDSSSPASFQIKVDPAERTAVRQPMISFMTTDALSGIDHYEIKLVDVTADRENKEDTFFIETSSPYQLTKLDLGSYIVVVRAFDKAGNWRDESVKLEIIREGTSISEKGVWSEGSFFSWWPFLLAILIIFIIIFIVLVLMWESEKKKRIVIAKKLRENEERIISHTDSTVDR